jgi:hypothetical protein
MLSIQCSILHLLTTRRGRQPRSTRRVKDHECDRTFLEVRRASEG